MRIIFLILLILSTLGISQIQSSFSEDSVPSCNVGVFVSDDVQCHTEDSTPCTAPSIEKNGLCVMKKLDVCEEEYMLKDGLCIKNTGFVRIDDPSFSRQSLQTGEIISESGTFVSIFVGSLGPILIVLFIVIYAVKKRITKKNESETR